MRGFCKRAGSSLGGSLLNLALSVGQANVELLGALNEGDSLLGGDALCDLGGVGAVVHEEQFHVFFVSDQELLEATCELVSGLGILLSADLGSSDSASESASHGRVDTVLGSPGSL